MNHLSVFLGIVTGLILGGSIFGIALMFQALTIIMHLSLLSMVIYLLINQRKKTMLKKEIINNCNQLRKKYTDKPDENRIIGYNAQKRLYNDFLNGKYKAYAFKLILDDVICPSTNTFIPIHSNFLYKTNTQIMHGYKDYKYKDMIKDIIEVYSKENI